MNCKMSTTLASAVEEQNIENRATKKKKKKKKNIEQITDQTQPKQILNR